MSAKRESRASEDISECKNDKKRDSKGRFVKGQSGNPGGTRGIPEELKRYGREAPARLREIADSPETPIKVRAEIERWFAEMTFGKPRQGVDLDAESLPQVVFVGADQIAD